MIDTMFILIWLAICGYWVYVYVRFYKALKLYESKLYKENSGWSPLKYASGFAYVDFALSGGHKQSGNAHVVNSGKRLVQAYEARFRIIGYGLLCSCIWFLIYTTVWSVE